MPSPGYRVSGKEVEVRDSGSRHLQLCGCCNLQLIQSHAAPSHGPPARVLPPLFFPAKSLLLPKPRGKKKHSKTTWSSLLFFRSVWSFSPFQNCMVLFLSLQNRMVLSSLHQSCLILSLLLQNLVVLSFPSSEPRGPLSVYLLKNLVVLPFPSELCGPPLFYFRTTWPSSFPLRTSWFSPSMAAVPRFKSQCPSSFAAPLLTPPIVSYTCQDPHILPALLGCHSKSGQVWPHGMEPIISKLSRRPCNQGELLPSPILGGSHSHLPGSKQGHSYLTYL